VKIKAWRRENRHRHHQTIEAIDVDSKFRGGSKQQQPYDVSMAASQRQKKQAAKISGEAASTVS